MNNYNIASKASLYLGRSKYFLHIFNKMAQTNLENNKFLQINKLVYLLPKNK